MMPVIQPYNQYLNVCKLIRSASIKFYKKIVLTESEKIQELTIQ